MNIVLKNKFNKNFYNLQKKLNNKFSSKLILKYGVQIGGHKKSLILTTTSVVFGIRSEIAIININKTFIELMKVLNIIEGLGFYRSVLYFVNNILSLRSSLYYTYGYYNRHLFFPGRVNILNPIKKFKLLKISRRKIKSLKKYLGLRNFFLFKSGRNLLRKFFISSKWTYGFLSNNKGFSKFIFNLFHEKIKVGKLLNIFHEKVKSFMDYFPYMPHYGFLGDHKINYWISNEFDSLTIPYNTIIDTSTTKSFFSMYGIPGNSCSVDSSLFYIVLMISYYLSGYNQMVLKFSLKKVHFKKLNEKKNFFFKRFKLLETLL